ncbi:hypothetical protein EJ04DRAFT_521590 [Polyplosphaeria fusca]|uniref:Uncharacterized protein n=1 Tax=Polyplosphaeria fusca TaxID=682080 RepID=A0A9P4V213_9PLEO|nr:hypothetical protein EJ04DRAFT_521590 [Polyplosphaeria fusca]
MLSMLGSAKVLVGKNDMRDYRGARVKRTMVTAIKCISGDGKEHFTPLYSAAREKAFTAKNAKAGFAASGLFPFNPDRILKSIPQPVPELTTSAANTIIVAPSLQEDVPQTPTMPVSSEGLVSLQNLIMKQDANALEEKSKQSL